MHYLHAILVEADSKEEAMFIAEAETNRYQGYAFDWRKMGAGRWQNQYPDVVSKKDEPELFEEILRVQEKSQQGELNHYNSILDTSMSIDEIISRENEFELFCLEQMVKIVSGSYTEESHFFNVNNCEARLTEKIVDNIMACDDNLYLVMCDIHN